MRIVSPLRSNLRHRKKGAPVGRSGPDGSDDLGVLTRDCFRPFLISASFIDFIGLRRPLMFRSFANRKPSEKRTSILRDCLGQFVFCRLASVSNGCGSVRESKSPPNGLVGHAESPVVLGDFMSDPDLRWPFGYSDGRRREYGQHAMTSLAPYRGVIGSV